MRGSTRGDGQTKRDELYAAIEAAPGPVATAPEVANELGVTQQAAHKRLQQAHEAGAVQRKTVGAAAVVWWAEECCPDYVSASASE